MRKFTQFSPDLMGVLSMAVTDLTGPAPAQLARGGTTDQYLTDLAVGAANGQEDFLTPQVFPILQRANASGKFKVWDRGAMLRPEFRAHTYGDRPVQGSMTFGEGDYSTQHRSLEMPVEVDQLASTDDPLEGEALATEYLTTQLTLDLDLRWVAAFLNANAAWAFKYQGVASSPNTAADSPEFLQLDQAGVNPAMFFRGRSSRMARMTGRRPNVLVLGADAYAALEFNEDAVDRIKYTQTGVLSEALMAQFFGVRRVVVANRNYNEAPEGTAAEFADMVDPKAGLLLYVPDRPTRDTPAAGYTFVWQRLYEKFQGDQERVLNELAIIRRGYDDRSGTRWVQAHHATQSQIVAPDLGMFLGDMVSAGASDW